MKNAVCFIVGSGENDGLDFSVSPDDYVIAADGGFAHLKSAGIGADLVIGDFDSLPAPPDHPHVITLPKEKDCTDMVAALQEGMRRGYQTFHIYGGTGGRIDHTLANIQALAFLSERQMRGYLYARDTVITAITHGNLAFGAGGHGVVSVFSHTETSLGVFLKGLQYELQNATLLSTFPLGVSNALTGAPATVSVTEGTLVVIFPRACMSDVQNV